MDDTEKAPRERPDGVNKKKLIDLDLEPKVSIYHKAHGSAPNHLLIANFSQNALIAFSRIAADYAARARDHDTRFDLFQVVGGAPVAFKLIFDWIQECVDRQEIVKVQEIPEPKKNPFGPTLDVHEAADILDIPAGSMQFFLERRLENIARKNLMPFSQVREFYDPESGVYQAGLKRIAYLSIFNAWWTYRLDETVNRDLMVELSYLRDEIPELDQDLHQAIDDKKLEIDRKKKEKLEQRRQAELAASANDQQGDRFGEQDEGEAAFPWNTSNQPAVAVPTLITLDQTRTQATAAWVNSNQRAAAAASGATWSTIAAYNRNENTPLIVHEPASDVHEPASTVPDFVTQVADPEKHDEDEKKETRSATDWADDVAAELEAQALASNASLPTMPTAEW